MCPKEGIQSYNSGFVLEVPLLGVICEFNYTLHLLETFHFLKQCSLLYKNCFLKQTHHLWDHFYKVLTYKYKQELYHKFVCPFLNFCVCCVLAVDLCSEEPRTAVAQHSQRGEEAPTTVLVHSATWCLQLIKYQASSSLRTGIC